VIFVSFVVKDLLTFGMARCVNTAHSSGFNSPRIVGINSETVG
jgi:hypothetical protein